MQQYTTTLFLEYDADMILSNLFRPAQADLLASLHTAQRYRSVEARAARPARLKPGWRKVNATNKFRQPKPPKSSPNSHNVNDGEGQNPKQPVREDTRPHKIRRKLQRLAG
jgi:hypothetical protein